MNPFLCYNIVDDVIDGTHIGIFSASRVGGACFVTVGAEFLVV